MTAVTSESLCSFLTAGLSFAVTLFQVGYSNDYAFASLGGTRSTLRLTLRLTWVLLRRRRRHLKEGVLHQGCNIVLGGTSKSNKSRKIGFRVSELMQVEF